MKIQVLLLALLAGSMAQISDIYYYDDYYYMNMTEYNKGADHGPYTQTTRLGYYYGYVEFGFISEFMFLPANARAHISIPASVIEAQELYDDYYYYSKGSANRKQATNGTGMELNFFLYDWMTSFDVYGSDYTIDEETGNYMYTFDIGNEYAIVLTHGTRYFYLGQLYPPMDTGAYSMNVKFTDQAGTVYESGDFNIEFTDWTEIGEDSMGEQLKDNLFEFRFVIDYVEDNSYPLLIQGFSALDELTEDLTIACVENCNNGASISISAYNTMAIYGLVPASVSSNTTMTFQITGLSSDNFLSGEYFSTDLINSFGGYFDMISFRQTEIDGNVTCYETKFAAGSNNRDYYCYMELAQGVSIREGDEIELKMDPPSDFMGMYYDYAYYMTGGYYDYCDAYQDRDTVYLNNFYIDGQASVTYIEWYYLLHKKMVNKDPKVKVKMTIRNSDGKKQASQGGFKADVYSWDDVYYYDDDEYYY